MMTAWDQRLPYTDEDKVKLKALWRRADLSHQQIADAMGRSLTSVKVKAVAMGLGRRPKEWTFGSAVLRKRQAEARGAAE